MWLKKGIYLLLFCYTLHSHSQGSASSNVTTVQIEAPQLDTLRTIRIYLPPGYANSMERFPVIYMHDAQNLFDTITAFSGEWSVDEFLDAQKGQKVIVVGVDHGNERRIAELTPFPHEKYGGGEGAAYMDFLVNTLKPYIDSNFRSMPGAGNTAIIGSSLGGLISFYAAVKYPQIFGMAGIFSPSFWFSEEIYAFAETSEIDPAIRFYFLAGTAESDDMVPDLLKMKNLLLKKGLPQDNIKVKVVEDGQHNEGFWSRGFPEAFHWLFPHKTKAE